MIGDLLVELRKDRKLKQADVAEALAISTGTVSNYECERNEPPLEMLVQLCKFYKTSSDYLLGLSRNKLSKENLDMKIGNESTLDSILFTIQNLEYADQCFVERLLLLLQSEKIEKLNRGEKRNVNTDTTVEK